MIVRFSNFKDFERRAAKEGIDEELEELRSLHTSFYREYRGYGLMVVSLPVENMIVIFKRHLVIVYPHLPYIDKEWMKELKDKKNGENTIVMYHVLDYSLQVLEDAFERIRKDIQICDEKLDLELVDVVSKRLRDLMEITESTYRMALRLERVKSKFLTPDLIDYDFDVLLAEAKHLLERMRSARKELTVIRNKCEIKVSKELNESIARLTEIMLVLTIVSLIISVPNTVATIFGVPTLAQQIKPEFVWFLLGASTIISILISIWYIRKKTSH